MKLRLITTGKLKRGTLRDIADDYIARIKHYLPFEEIAVEGEADILKKITPDDFLIVCDEAGKEFSSVEFAKFVGERQVRSTKALTFVLGPAEGFSKEMKKKGKIALSFSRFTIQHDLALIVLLEQIYRACTIIKGEKYHK